MDPKEMKELLDGLVKSNQALSETITARFSVADTKAREEEKNTLVKDVLDGLSKAGYRPTEPARKMLWGTAKTKAEEGAEVLPFNKFLQAVAMKDVNLLRTVKAASGQSEDVNADGGFTVPVEYANEIIALERQSSIARTLARVFPMGTKTRNIPRELAKPAVYWVGEGVEPSLSKGTTEQVNQVAKKLMAIVPFTEELLEDNTVSYDQFIAQIVAQEMGREEDKIAFVGDTAGAGDPFKGVFFATGVNSVSLAGADLAYADLVNLMMAPKAPYRNRAQWVLSTTALKKLMKLVDDQNRPLWTMPEAGNPGRILGKAYSETDQIPDTLGTQRANGTNTAILFGAWDGLWISPRGGYTVKASDSASKSDGKSAFTLDEVWFKFRRRQDISVANPEAFGKLALPAA